MSKTTDLLKTTSASRKAAQMQRRTAAWLAGWTAEAALSQGVVVENVWVPAADPWESNPYGISTSGHWEKQQR